MVFYMWEQGAIYLITFNKYIPLILIQFIAFPCGQYMYD